MNIPLFLGKSAVDDICIKKVYSIFQNMRVNFTKKHIVPPYVYDWVDTSVIIGIQGIIPIHTASAINYDTTRFTALPLLTGNIVWLADWDVTNIRSISNSFYSACGNIQHLANWNIQHISYICNPFYNSEVHGNIKHLKNWNTRALEYANGILDTDNLYGDISALENWDLSNLQYAKYMFTKNISGTFYVINTVAVKGWQLPRIIDNTGTPLLQALSGEKTDPDIELL